MGIMQSNHSKRSCALWTRGFIILGAVLVLTFSARPAAAAPFAYVTNEFSNTVSVIDTANNNVAATVPVGINPLGIAVTPDGTRAYVTNFGANTVSVIDAASNTVVATVPVGNLPAAVVVTPDGQLAYVTNNGATTVSVIARPATRWWPRSRWGVIPLGWPSPRTGNTPMWRILAPPLSR
jgi:YVTN family beta-propeller protein